MLIVTGNIDNCYMLLLHTNVIRKSRDFMETLSALIALWERNPPVILTKVR